MTRPWIFALAVTAVAAVPGVALAQWTFERGTGQAIVTGVVSDSGRGFDADGRVVDIADYDKRELYLLIEYGLTDDLTLIANPSLRRVSVGGRTTIDGFGVTELGGRYRLFNSDRTVASVQATVRVPGTGEADPFAQVGTDRAEYDLRGLVGTSFEAGSAQGFANVQAGYRIRSGQPPNEFRADATLGLRPTPRWLVYGQVFNVVSDGAGQGVFGSYRYHNAHLNLAYDLDARWTIQAGVMATLDGENALRERGVTVGLWRRF